MGGSGGGGSYRLNQSDLAALRAEAQERLERTRNDADVNGLLQRLLVEINDRDHERVNHRLDEIELALQTEGAEVDRLLFGGSVAKHTWVDGVSDVDSIVVLTHEHVGDRSSEEMRRQFQEALRSRLDMTEVEAIDVGRMAVTVTFRDGMKIQLLPAVECADGLAVSSPSGQGWAPVDPKRFAERLTDVNRRQAGAVVPAIKIAKAVLAARYGEDDRPTGYHVEALAVAAFSNYDGPRTPKAMAKRFFERAAADVLKPVADVTGQSRYVDADLGAEGSAKRIRLAGNLGRIALAMETASSIGDWEALLG